MASLSNINISGMFLTQNVISKMRILHGSVSTNGILH